VRQHLQQIGRDRRRSERGCACGLRLFHVHAHTGHMCTRLARSFGAALRHHLVATTRVAGPIAVLSEHQRFATSSIEVRNATLLAPGPGHVPITASAPTPSILDSDTHALSRPSPRLPDGRDADATRPHDCRRRDGARDHASATHARPPFLPSARAGPSDAQHFALMSLARGASCLTRHPATNPASRAQNPPRRRKRHTNVSMATCRTRRSPTTTRSISIRRRWRLSLLVVMLPA